MSQLHENFSKETVDVSLERLSIQANDLPERVLPTDPDDNATISSHSPDVANHADTQRDFTDLETSLHITNDPHCSIAEIAGTGSHGKHSDHPSTFLSLPIEIRDMILKYILGGKKVCIRSECTSSHYFPFSSKVSPSRWCEAAPHRSNKGFRKHGRSIPYDIHFVPKA